MKMKDFMMKLKELWYSFLRLFVHHYKLTVSYNHIYGDADDVVYVVKKFYKKKDKYLYFKSVEGELVEIRGAEGLNYRIEEL